MNILRFWITLVFICFSLNSGIQHANAKLPPKMIDFENFTTKDGLSNPVVYDIVQDRNGFLWFATGNGLSKFDGYDFKNYLPDDQNPNAIGKGPVIQLHIDRQKRFWVVVFGKGLFRYDEKKDNFVAYHHEPGNSNSLPSNSLYSITEDSSGVFWISTIDKGITRFDEKKNTFFHYRHEPENKNSLSSDKAFAIFCDSKNNIWISYMKNGVDRYDPEKKQFTHYLKEAPQAVAIMEDQSNDIWIPTLGEGVYRYVRKENRFVSYKNIEDDPKSISHNNVVKVFEDHLGTLWLTTWGGGLNIYDRKEDQFIVYKNQSANSKSLSNDNTWGIFEDNTGVMWIGTYGAGINKYDRKEERFSLMRYDPIDINSLRHNSVKTIYEDKQGYLWLGTLGGGLSRYNQKTKTFKHFLHDPDNPVSISNNNIWKIVEDKDHDLWIATENGLNRYNRAKNRFVHYKHNPDDPDSIGSNTVRTVYVDNKNNIWIGTQLVGIDRFDRHQNKFIHYKVSGPHNSVLYQDKSGTLWAANVYALYRYDEKNDLFQITYLDPENQSQPIKGFFLAITDDKENNLWIGTGGGLKKLDLKNNTMKHYGVDDGLNDEAIAGLLFDGKGQLWVSTARGLSLLNPDDDSIRNYELGSYNRGASYMSRTGTLYFGGLNGLTHFSADKIGDNPHIPNIVITSYKKLNKEVQLTESLTGLTNLNLTYKDRFFSFEFAALDFSDPEKNKYRYKLHGFDQDWIYIDSKRRFAAYTNLDAGEYTFQVSGSNNDGIWNKNGKSIRINISPQWWKTKVFYFTLICIFITAIGLITIYLIRLKSEISERKQAEHSLMLSKQDLIKAHDNLEIRVKERTSELDKANKILKVEINDRIKTENVLTKREFQLTETQKVAQIGNWDLDLAIPKLEWSNETYKLFDKNPGNFVPSFDEFARLVHPNDFETMQTKFNNALESDEKPYHVEVRIINDSGREWVMEAFGKVNRDNNGKALSIFGTAQDVTERSLVDALQESEEKYRLLVENQTDLVVKVDLEGRFQFVSQSYCELFHKTESELLGKQFMPLVHPEDQEPTAKAMKALFREPFTAYIEQRAMTKNGWKWLAWMDTAVKDKNNEIVSIIGVGRDITEKKDFESALQNSQETFLSVLDGINATIYVSDIDTHEILFANKYMRDKFQDDLMGKICFKVFRNQTGPCSFCTNKKLLDKNGEPTGVHVWDDKNPITNKWYINHDRAIRWTDGRYVRLQIATDITELKNMESKLRQAQKMESIGTLAGGIAHDFNNILFPILGHTEMLIEDVPEDSPFRNDLNQIYTGAIRASELVKQILTFSRQKDGELKLMKMQPIIKEALKLIRSTIPTTIEIKQNLQSDCGPIKADPTQIHQIVMNLATNAYHAMEEAGGELNIRLNQVELEETDLFDLDLTPGGYVCLTVADTGVGMDKNLQEKIFDPFFTTKEKSKGTGMGLSVVHGIVKAMNGTIHIYSESGKGTEFHVYLPLVESLSEKQNIHQPQESIQGGIEHILLLDDEDIVVTVVKQMLERLGYQVTSLTSSLETLEAFRVSPDKFDIVITDMQMPNMSGDKLAGELTKIRPDIPILLCTGFSETMSEEKAASLGINGFLLKPIVMKDLSHKIREVLDTLSPI